MNDTATLIALVEVFAFAIMVIVEAVKQLFGIDLLKKDDKKAYKRIVTILVWGLAAVVVFFDDAPTVNKIFAVDWPSVVNTMISIAVLAGGSHINFDMMKFIQSLAKEEDVKSAIETAEQVKDTFD